MVLRFAGILGPSRREPGTEATLQVKETILWLINVDFEAYEVAVIKPQVYLALVAIACKAQHLH